VLVVHNPLGWVRRKYIKVIVTISDVAVTSFEGVVLSSQVILAFPCSCFIFLTFVTFFFFFFFFLYNSNHL
jgi:hypothetical protein